MKNPFEDLKKIQDEYEAPIKEKLNQKQTTQERIRHEKKQKYNRMLKVLLQYDELVTKILNDLLDAIYPSNGYKVESRIRNSIFDENTYLKDDHWFQHEAKWVLGIWEPHEAGGNVNPLVWVNIIFDLEGTPTHFECGVAERYKKSIKKTLFSSEEIVVREPPKSKVVGLSSKDLVSVIKEFHPPAMIKQLSQYHR